MGSTLNSVPITNSGAETLNFEFPILIIPSSLLSTKISSEYIEKSLVGWKSQRLSFVSTALIRLATYEMMFMTDIPVKVSINEAIELSKKYDDEKAYALVNGSLNAIAEALSRK